MKVHIIKSALLGVGGIMTLAAVALPAATVSADTCVRAAPSIVATPDAQSGMPGDALTYSLAITNNDSVDCGVGAFNYEPEALPSGWGIGQEPVGDVYQIAPGDSATMNVTYYSAFNAIPIDYHLTYDAYRSYDNSYDIAQATVVYAVLPDPNLDTTAPVVQITAPTTGAVLKRNSTTVIQATATDNVGVVRVDFKVDGVTLCTGAATTSCSWHVPNSKGNHYISVYAYDARGNVNLAMVNVSVK